MSIETRLANIERQLGDAALCPHGTHVRHLHPGEPDVSVISVCSLCGLQKLSIVVEHIDEWRKPDEEERDNDD